MADPEQTILHDNGVTMETGQDGGEEKTQMQAYSEDINEKEGKEQEERAADDKEINQCEREGEEGEKEKEGEVIAYMLSKEYTEQTNQEKEDIDFDIEHQPKKEEEKGEDGDK